MSEPRWTPGPWLRDGRTVYALMHFGWKKGVETLCNRFSAHVQETNNNEESEANARLIAAAPDLYAALEHAAFDFKELLEWIKYENTPLREIERKAIAARLAECRAALAKARGEV